MIKKIGMALLFIIGLFLSSILGTWLYIKIIASHNAEIHDATESPSEKCVINSYVTDYEPYGLPGFIFQLFSSSHFFRVYTSDGKLIESSEWLLSQKEFADSAAPEWNPYSGDVFYPGRDGWLGWSVPECAGDATERYLESRPKLQFFNKPEQVEEDTPCECDDHLNFD